MSRIKCMYLQDSVATAVDECYSRTWTWSRSSWTTIHWRSENIFLAKRWSSLEWDHKFAFHRLIIIHSRLPFHLLERGSKCAKVRSTLFVDFIGGVNPRNDSVGKLGAFHLTHSLDTVDDVSAPVHHAAPSDHRLVGFELPAQEFMGFWFDALCHPLLILHFSHLGP